jgi:LPS-assembly protein
VNIRYLALLVSLLAVTVDSRGEQGAGDDHASVDPFAPTSAWAVCPPPPDRDYDLTFSGDPDQAPTDLQGNMAERTGDGKLRLFGNAEVQRGAQRLRGGRILYNQTDATVTADGDVVYDEPNLHITGTDGKFWLDEDRGELFDTEFRFYERHGRGVARKAYVLKPGVSRFKKVMYTTCPQNSNAWSLRATKVVLDQNTGTGVARNARLNIKDVPIFYTPYISFPIDDRRKTGFLIPSFGSSNNSGVELKVPFYWNIAPNYDATLTPRYLSDRGTQLNTEVRFLRPMHEGSIRVEHLHHDNLTENDRTRVAVRDDMRFSPNLTANIDYDHVSDSDYLNDLGDSLSLASVTYLRRTAQAAYTTDWWQAGVQVDDFQTVDATISRQNQPYQRLPRLVFDAVSPVNLAGLEPTFSAEAVRFDAKERVTADRVDLWPSVSWPYRGTALDTTPKLGVRYTAYQLDNEAVGQRAEPTRTTPFFSLDNTVYLERDASIVGYQYTQTLEPRLFYLYVKGEKQQDLPLFDTSEPTFTYRELFEENRFNGADRMGDANQAALAVTTRLIDPNTGVERLQASVGQLFYFANRNVTLNNTAPQTNGQSNIAGELEIALSRSWTGKTDLIWDAHDNSTERTNARIQYHPGFRKIANLSYRYLRGEQNQLDASILWPLSPAWHVIGRWYYDIGESKQLETLAGIEYDSCCWGLRFVTRDYVDSTSDKDNRVFMAQIVLKGLATFGSKIESVLEDGILGYSERPQD